MSKEKILIIEDNLEMVRILGDHFLRHQGYHVLEAYDGQTGLSIAMTQNPDLIMLDMHLPQLDGLGVLEALAQAQRNIPVIFMTVSGSETLAINAFRLGVKDYLVKPFSLQEACQAIDKALQAQRLLREKEELTRNLIAAETVRQTVATLAHHINNHLTVACGSLALLREAVEYQFLDEDEVAQFLTMLDNSEASLSKIAQTLKTLQKITQIKPTAYFETTHILHIEATDAKEIKKD